MNGLGDVIAAQVAAWGGVDLPLERSLFGTTDPDGIAAAIDAFCAEHLGAGVHRYRFFDSSSGSVHGVELADGRAVVVKGHRAGVAVAYLRALDALRTDLVADGYPAPQPLAGPTSCGNGHLSAEELLRQRTPDDAHDPEVIRLLARGLADFVERAAPHRGRLATVAHPMLTADGALYPAPHSARFDFDATAAGAEWIDDLASQSQRLRADLPPPVGVVTHGDWRVENVSMADDRIEAVYDWDSVAIMDELVALAAASTTFTVDWEREQARRFPTPSEIGAFIGDYEVERARPFVKAEGRRLAAAVVASLAYGARCEHAIDHRPDAADDCQQGLLALLADGLLTDGLDALRRR